MIMLHTVSGNEIAVNPKEVVTISQCPDYSHITLSNGKTLDVVESLVEVTQHL